MTRRLRDPLCCSRARVTRTAQIATRSALDALGSVWTELRNGTCLAFPQEDMRRRQLCRQLMGSTAVAWTPECLIAMHLRRHGVQLNIGDAFGAGRFLRPPSQRRRRRYRR